MELGPQRAEGERSAGLREGQPEGREGLAEGVRRRDGRCHRLWLAGAAAPAAVSAASETDGDAPAGAPEAAREPSDPPATPGAVESGVRAADQLLREARFEEALARIEGIRGELAVFGAGDAGRRLRARTEVVAATAYVALDREDAARECFRRALAAEPALDLDPATTAPKVLRVFRAVRAEPRGAR